MTGSVHDDVSGWRLFEMQLRGVLTVLLMSLCTAHGLRCYTCITSDPKSCTDILPCPQEYDRCTSFTLDDVLYKGCMTSNLCVPPISCCKGDLCNGAIPTGPSVVLLLVSSAIITLFI
ncbi:lymphocyte antigen 6G-like [Betta splendens]|uniref:Lymphocyte antigen 6G-like n=1 Tax=Betta splendens TaxID=158456 RepID=A0A9W2XZJ5_BETSP|nr:lymphocyte antigen 6G-like [Betta splendens]